MAIVDALNRAYDRYYAGPERRILAKDARFDGGLAGPPVVGDLTQHFEIQDDLRPLFGKGPAVAPSIGHHPDFEHLKATRATEFAPITTLFMDMEGSTRLGLIYTPEQVFKTKNAVIQSTIDIIKSFDGHVHRIMGDAVMAFFGGKRSTVEQGAIDALNCAATLRALIVSLVEKRLPEMADEPLGIRIGLDYGAKEKVLWGPYGYPGMEEITATSFHVDVASKLQHAAGRNQIMLGDSLRALLDVPDVLLQKKTFIKNGEEQEEPYATPNYAGADGKPINYRKYLFKWDEYLSCTHLAAAAPALLGKTGGQLRVDVVVAHERKDSAIAARYSPCGQMVPKQKQLRFQVEIPFQPRVPLALDFRVENHGLEASRAENSGNHADRQDKTKLGDLTCTHWESTLYRGLHYLNVLVSAQGKQVMARRLGVWVE